MRGTRTRYSLGSAGLAEGTAANTFQIATPFAYVIDGRAYHKAATNDIAFAAHSSSALAALAAKKTAVFFFFINSSGTVTVVQGTTYPATTEQDYVSRAIEWPDLASNACFGALKIQTNNAATFTAGSTDLSATDVVDTFYNVADDYGVPVTI